MTIGFSLSASGLKLGGKGDKSSANLKRIKRDYFSIGEV